MRTFYHYYKKKLIDRTVQVREDTNKKIKKFRGRTTKGVGRVKPPTTKQKKHFFLKFGCFSPKTGKKKKKSVSGYYKNKKKSGMDH